MGAEPTYTILTCSECGKLLGLQNACAVSCLKHPSAPYGRIKVLPASVLEERDRQLAEMTEWASSPENPLFDEGWEAGTARGRKQREELRSQLTEARAALGQIVEKLGCVGPEEVLDQDVPVEQGRRWIISDEAGMAVIAAHRIANDTALAQDREPA